MKPIARKQLTVDIIVRRRISFRLGQEAIDWSRGAMGTIVALTDEGALLRRWVHKDNCCSCERWFVEYCVLRPHKDGWRYLKEVTD